eukprot:scaffold32274_cov64-Cyclotella_meneghiniana.AAC.1
MMLSTTPPSSRKVGHCPACNVNDAQFSKSQWKKPASHRRCIVCVGVVDTPASLSDKNGCGIANKAEEEMQLPTSVADGNDLVDTPVAENKAAAAASVNPPADESESEDEVEGNWSPLQQSDQDEKPTHKPVKESIRERMKRSRDDALSTNSSNNKRYKREGSSDEEDEENNNVSVERLKQQILGRPIHSYDVNNESQNFKGGNTTQMIMDPSVFADGITVAEHLRAHLSCPVCFERLYNPVSLLCGHSFCKKCIMWWINRNNDSIDENDELQVFGTCPSCRHPIVGDNKDNLFQINTGLKACMDTLFGEEMNQRRLAEQRELKKATTGENGGAHERGCEEIVPLTKENEIAWGRNEVNDQENGWVSLHALSESGRGTKLHVRRNIILDECNQQYQLALAFTKCVISKGSNQQCIVDVELCLLGMEEDEIDDSGFPVLVTEGSDDEALICTSNDRVHTCIESSARVAPAALLEKKDFSCFANDESYETQIKELPLSRGMIGRDGSVRFRIDIEDVLHNEAADENSSMTNPKLIKLVFCHVDTGTKLELRTPAKNDHESNGNSDEEVEFGGTRITGVRNKASKFVVDAFEEEDEDSNEPNEYEEDEFLVAGTQSDEEDGCNICNEH